MINYGKLDTPDWQNGGTFGLGDTSVANSDGSITTYASDGSATTVFTDGSSTTIAADGTVTSAPAPAGATPAPAVASSTPAASTSANGGWLTSVFAALTGAAQASTAVATTVATINAPTAQLTAAQQGAFASINATRAAQGLAPLTPAQYQQMYAPTAAGLPLNLSSLTSNPTLLLLGGAALLALFAASRRS